MGRPLVYGTAEVGGQARVECFYSPSVSLEWSQLFLAQLAAREPEAPHVVLWDGAGFHPQDGAAGLPDKRVCEKGLHPGVRRCAIRLIMASLIIASLLSGKYS